MTSKTAKRKASTGSGNAGNKKKGKLNDKRNPKNRIPEAVTPQKESNEEGKLCITSFLVGLPIVTNTFWSDSPETPTLGQETQEESQQQEASQEDNANDEEHASDVGEGDDATETPEGTNINVASVLATVSKVGYFNTSLSKKLLKDEAFKLKNQLETWVAKELFPELKFTVGDEETEAQYCLLALESGIVKLGHSKIHPACFAAEFRGNIGPHVSKLRTYAQNVARGKYQRKFVLYLVMGDDSKHTKACYGPLFL